MKNIYLSQNLWLELIRGQCTSSFNSIYIKLPMFENKNAEAVIISYICLN